jgi:hypothetical protein
VSSAAAAPEFRQMILLGDDDSGTVTYTLAPHEFLRVESAFFNASGEPADHKVRVEVGCIYQDQSGMVVSRAGTNFEPFIDPIYFTFRVDASFAIGATYSIPPSTPAINYVASAGLPDTILPPGSIVSLFVSMLDVNDNDTPIALVNGVLWVQRLSDQEELDVVPPYTPESYASQTVPVAA